MTHLISLEQMWQLVFSHLCNLDLELLTFFFKFHHNKYSTEHIFTVYARLFKRFPLQCFILLYHDKNLLTWPEWLAVITTDTQAGRRSRFFNSEGGRRERCFPLWRPKWSQRLLQVHDALWYTVEFNYRNAFEGSGNERVLCLCTYCMYV